MELHVVLALVEGLSHAALNDPAALDAALDAAVAAGRFTLLRKVVAPFEPHGVTACAIVGESHLALHSWPEEGRLFVDIASCRDLPSARRALDAIVAHFPGARIATLDERLVTPHGAFAVPPPQG
jgi:S-adenosylmethionine decarboxylase